jgi:cell fate (sporulation/competence/biofilm development) regulator YmcA (YheA/YmcA/DUF963 family)
MVSAKEISQAPLLQQQREMLTENADYLRMISNRIQAILSSGARTGAPLYAELISLIYDFARLAD